MNSPCFLDAGPTAPVALRQSIRQDIDNNVEWDEETYDQIVSTYLRMRRLFNELSDAATSSAWNELKDLMRQHLDIIERLIRQQDPNREGM